MTDPMHTTINGVKLTVIPRVEYTIQVIAREDKGLRGVDYNKSPKVIFKTSKYFSTPSSLLDSDHEEPKNANTYPEIGGDDELIVDQGEGRSDSERSSNDNRVLTYCLIAGGSLGVLVILIGVAYKLSMLYATIRMKKRSPSSFESPTESLQPDLELAKSTERMVETDDGE